MTAVRVRLLGGTLNGQVLWVDGERTWLEVHVAGGVGFKKTLRYRRDGAIARFVLEPEASPSHDDTPLGAA